MEETLRLNVKEDGFYGIYFNAENSDNKKIVLVLGGSEGNENIPVRLGSRFADEGISALGICYWNVEDLPDNLVEVPVETIENAVEWSREQGYEEIYIYGISKGAELALLSATLIDGLSGVIATSPASHIFSGLYGRENSPSKIFIDLPEFIYKDEPFDFVPCRINKLKSAFRYFKNRELSTSYIYEDALKLYGEGDAQIPVEKIDCDIILLYSLEDTVWPSKQFADIIEKRLNENNWQHRLERHEYEKASHLLMDIETPSFRAFSIERKFPEECLESRKDSFRKIMEFIGKNSDK